jgi:nucleotide-binding universal stress UspA family protein
MYQNILIATDGSDVAQKAVSHGLSLAKAVGAKVTAVVVEVPFAALQFPEYERDRLADLGVQFAAVEKEHAGKILGDVAVAAEKRGVPCETVQVQNARPYQGILQAAESRHCDLIVMGSHGRGGVSGILLGSVTNKVTAHTKLPVLVCH